MNASAIEIEPITGRYLRITFKGAPHRIYFEESGEGIPLLCLHTAGSDTRQYRSLMNEAKVTNNFKVICFDLPRSEEHTSELQSLMRISYAVFCLKKKKKAITIIASNIIYNHIKRLLNSV